MGPIHRAFRLCQVPAAALALVLLGASYDVFAQATGGWAPSPPFVRPHTPTLGPANAKVHLVEFLDPACEGCRAFYPVVKQLMAENPGRIRLWVRYVPIHKGADFVVKALEAARAQGKFWEALELLFAKQGDWTRHHTVMSKQVLEVLSGIGGLDMERLRRDMGNPEFARIVEQDMADAKAVKVMQTPTFYVNGKPLSEYGLDQLRAQVRQEVATQYR
jgi:protein-disulfide isomerase